jgi:hypothetical protein
MKKALLFIFLFSFSFLKSFSQSNSFSNSVSVSPGSLLFGRANLKYEKLTNSHFSYGSRVEASLLDKGFDKHLWIIPYGRFYFFDRAQNGLYFEGGIGYRARYAKSAEWSSKEDWFKSAGVVRAYLGGQWFVGRNSNIPIDIGLGINTDARISNLPEGVDIGSMLVGPLSMLNFRIQTGFSF